MIKVKWRRPGGCMGKECVLTQGDLALCPKGDGVDLFLIILTLTVCCIAGRLSAQPGNKPYRAVMDADGVQQVNILAGDYFFRPSHIIVKVNVPVRLVVRVERGIVPHGLVLKALEANISIDEDLSRESQTFTFTPSAPGRYAFYCPKKLLFFKSHREHGMEGILEVVE